MINMVLLSPISLSVYLYHMEKREQGKNEKENRKSREGIWK